MARKYPALSGPFEELELGDLVIVLQRRPPLVRASRSF